MMRGIEAERKRIHLAVLVIPLAAWLGLRQSVPFIRPALWLVFVLALALDLTRRRHAPFRVWIDGRVGHLIRPHETWHPLGSTILFFSIAAVFLVFRPAVALAASGFILVGDALAALVGSRYGRHRFGHGKSLEGSLACFAGCLLVGAAGARLDPALRFPAWGAGAVVATLAESATPAGYDNLSVPVLAAVAMTVAGQAG